MFYILRVRCHIAFNEGPREISVSCPLTLWTWSLTEACPISFHCFSSSVRPQLYTVYQERTLEVVRVLKFLENIIIKNQFIGQFRVFSGGSLVRYLSANAGDAGSAPGSRRSPRAGSGSLFQHSCLGNSWTEKPDGLQSMRSQKSWIWFRDFNNNWWLSGKESAYSTGDMGSILGSGISPGEGNGNSLQYSCLFSI